ncbi:MAG: Spy/CpxP family protein refolding chaperone [Azonexus sp.]|jgi:Spy/CpxP family protein refolding chaperone|nr:Spy/CpxP family protein refolding chaperone [Azonexus sp.]
MKTTSRFSFKRLAAVTAIALALPLGAAAFDGRGDCGMAGPGVARSGMGMGGGWSHPGLARLDLTEAQRDRIFDIRHAQAPLQRDNMKAMMKARSDLRALAASPDYSEAKAKELADAVAAAAGKMALDRVKAERQIQEVLTPEQRQQLAQMKDERQERKARRGDGPRRKAGQAAQPKPGA